MAALLVVRLLIPILISTVSIACAARLNAHVIKRVSCVTLICTDLMAMVSFYLIYLLLWYFFELFSSILLPKFTI